MSPERLRSLGRAVIDAAVVATAVGFVASYFPAALLLAPTTTNGGDMGSHYFPAVYLRDTLLPRGQLMGWCPGNYGGYPLFQFYFPLPFLLIAALSAAVPLTVAFKIGSVIGTILLPAAAYGGLRFLGVAFPGPALGALASLCFLFMEANSMWGGNIPSMLAGEFAFSQGLALAVLFVGTIHHTMETGRGRIGNAVLVAVMGLCHGYALLWSGLVSLLGLVATRGWWRRFGTLVVVHGLAILLMGFWLVQLLWYAPWTTAFNPTWILNSWKEVLPPILWPAAGVAVASIIVQLVVCAVRRERFPRSLAILWGTIVISLFFFATAHAFHVVDIRFMPFLQLGLCLAAAAGLGRLLAYLPAPEVWPVAAALATLPFVQSQVTFIPSWITWNYSGFEEKGPWPVLRDLSAHLGGDFRDPRVVYEHSPHTEALGTIRAFENLPLFSGRSTLEGLYMQSSLTTPFVFYLQSEVSKHISCPLPSWGCTRVDLDRGVDHLRMFNVSQLITRSPEVQKAAAAHPGLSREITVGAYEVFRVNDNDGRYAVPLVLAPALVRTATWKEEAYQWFKQAGPQDPVPVLAIGEVSEEEEARFAGAFSAIPRPLPRRPLGAPPALTEEMDTNRITVRGTRPGHPILVRISYHPRWRATTGERVWLAAPNFMLVFPVGDHVELEFGAGPALVAGRVLTGVGLGIVALALLPMAYGVRARWRLFVEAVGASPPFRAVVARVREIGEWSEGRRRGLLAGALGLVGMTLAAVAVANQGADADSLYRKGQTLYGADRLRDSLPYFVDAYRLAPLSATAIHARYFEALVYFREEKWEAAEQRFRELVERFPEAMNAPEALYHVGLCRDRRGDVDGAVATWQDAARRFPESNWAGFARERLKERGRDAG
jgi:tetratricopeptide (TPR) repeat protein